MKSPLRSTTRMRSIEVSNRRRLIASSAGRRRALSMSARTSALSEGVAMGSVMFWARDALSAERRLDGRDQLGRAEGLAQHRLALGEQVAAGVGAAHIEHL